MTDPRWDRLELLLEQGASIPPAERAKFVARATGGDPALGRELAALLEASSGAGEYLSRLRQELLGSGIEGVVRDAAAAGEGPDPWIGRTVSHYEILERIGGGGMGVIYRARDTRLDRAVALKFIAPEIRRDAVAQDRFLKEARAASALDHPNICTIHEIGETDDGRPFIVMAAYAGETLGSRLERPPVPDDEALDISTQVARALAAAHERNIVHRDVKPDNVFITREGVVKLLDFGLARMADDRMSGPGTAAGTVAYMSPERVAGRPADGRSDVWSLGVILFEMLAGVRPFVAENPSAVLELILAHEPDLSALRPDLAPAVLALARRTLAKDPEQRFRDGRELLDALTQARIAPSGGGVRVPSRPRSTGRRTLTILAVALGLLAVGAVAALRNRGAPAVAPVGSVSSVLWVDDNPENNSEITKQLESRGVRVTAALSTADGVRRYDPAVHRLVISDMGRFEGVNQSYVERAGLDLLRQLKTRRPDVQVVFCTSARAAATYRAEALAAGARAIVEDCGEVLRMMGF